MKYRGKEIENAIIINGTMYVAIYDNHFTCLDCHLLKVNRSCRNYCAAFEKLDENVIFRTIDK